MKKNVKSYNGVQTNWGEENRSCNINEQDRDICPYLNTSGDF